MSDRGASEVIGFVLVFALVVSSVAVISVGGLGSLQSARDAEQMENAEHAYDVFRDNVEDIYLRGAPSRATELSLGSASLYTEENVTIRVELRDSGSTIKEEEWESRPLVFEGEGERKLVYEGGATFRTSPSGDLRRADPPFVFRQDGTTERVLLPVVAPHAVDAQSAGGSTVLVRTRETNETVVAADDTGAYDEVRFTVTSPRYELWEEYFKSADLTDCSNPGTDTIQCSFEPGTLERVYVVYHELTLEIDQ